MACTRMKWVRLPGSMSTSGARSCSRRTASWWAIMPEGEPDGTNQARSAEAQLHGKSAAPGRLGTEGNEPGAEGRRRLCTARTFGLRQDHSAQPRVRTVAADAGAHLV